MAEVNKSKIFDFNAGILKKGAFIVIIKTEWNATIVDELETGCIRQLKHVEKIKVRTITVPGAFEIPFAVRKFWENKRGKKKPDAFIALGCVIRGDTPHFDYVCKAVTDGIVALNLSLSVPVIFGVLTVENEQQARERIGGIHGHKGKEAAITAIKMIALSSK